MDYIEFDTHLSKEGTIVVPDEYREDLAKKELLHVKVTVPKHRRPRRKDEDAIAYYLEYPIIIPGVKAPSRDEIYEGR